MQIIVECILSKCKENVEKQVRKIKTNVYVYSDNILRVLKYLFSFFTCFLCFFEYMLPKKCKKHAKIYTKLSNFKSAIIE